MSAVLEQKLAPTPFVTIFHDNKGTRITRAEPMSLAEIERVIRKAPTRRAKDDLPLLKLARFSDCPTQKGCLRHDKNVVALSGIVVDYDGEAMAIQAAADRLAEHELAALLYTSTSHTPDRPRWRVIVPLAVPVEGSVEQLAVAHEHWVGIVNAILGGVLAGESYTLSQSYYFGNVEGRPPAEIIRLDWACLDEAQNLPKPIAKPRAGTKGNGTADTGTVVTLDDIATGQHIHTPTRNRAASLIARGVPEAEVLALLRAYLKEHKAAWELTDNHRQRWQDCMSKLPEIVSSAKVKFAPPEAYADEGGPHADRDHEHGEHARHNDRAKPRIVLRPLAEIVAERREPAWLKGLHRVLEQAVLAMLVGARSTLKSFIGLDWSLRAAAAGHPVVILSAEGAGLDRRTDAWMRTHGRGLRLEDLPLVALERPLALNVPSVLGELQEAIDATGKRPALIFVDTLSKYTAGIDENDNTDMAAFLGMLAVKVRDFYGCTVLLVAHTGHADPKRPRGAYVLKANPDAEYIVERPDPQAMTVTVTRERFKDCAALEPVAYAAQVVDLGRVDQYGDAVTSLALISVDAKLIPRAAEHDLKGPAQRRLLDAIRERQKASDTPLIWTLNELRQIGRETGMVKSTARAAVDVVAFSPFMTASVGGYRLSDAVGT